MTQLQRLLLLGLVLLGACADRVTAPDAAAARPAAAPLTDEDDDEDGDDDDCDDDDDDDPCFLRPADDAPPLADTVVSFYAVRGQQRVGRIVYRARPGASDSTELVRLTVPANARLRRPDGTLVATGDSVLITMTVVDATRGVVYFAPAGLSFGPTQTAALRFSFAETDDDVNDDGAVDATDAALQATFAVWRQADAASPWTALASTRSGETVTAQIPGFTNYALAY